MKQIKLFPDLEPASISDMMYGRAEITIENLQPLKNIELDAIATLMGIPTYGTKKKKIYRILDLWDLRHSLSEYEHSHKGAQKLADDYRRVELHDMARRSKTWKSGNKFAIAISLLTWRAMIRRKGQKFYNEMVTLKKERRLNANTKGSN